VNGQTVFPDKEPIRGEIIQPIPFRPPGPLGSLPKLNIPWLRLMLVAVACISLFSAWYVTSANSIEIVAYPADATINVKKLIAPRIRGNWILRPGSHRVEAVASGYKKYSELVVVSDEAIQKHRIELEPLPGHLRIEITPVKSAKVILDEQEMADAPTTLRDLASGPHNIRISAPRYKLFESSVEIEGKDIEQMLSVEMQPAWAEVSFDSSPQNAAVVVDGEPIGVTPLSAEIIEGDRSIELRLQGYKPWRRTITVVAGESLETPRVLLAKADGKLSISSLPTGATITVDGDYKGKSPLSVSVNPDKRHTIRAIKPGYLPASANINAASGETKAVNLSLEPELAQVRFIISPNDAEVLIDGVLQKQTNQVLMLPTHEHSIQIRKPGYNSYETTITPRKGVEKRIKVRLRPGDGSAGATTTSGNKTAAKSPNVGTVKPGANNDGNTIKTFLAQELTLLEGGSITMGASRRDSARRANETLRAASLKRPFYLATKEVTNGQFRRFLANHNSKSSNGQNLNDDNQPVANVSWNTAAIFCNWLSRKDSLPVFYQIKSGRVLGINPAALGYRLPSEAEWALAARISGGETFNYPWAGTYPPQGRPGNFADQSAKKSLKNVIPNYDDGFVVAAPVGSFPPNLRGIYDMGGNVAEWVHDFYVAAPSGNNIDPLGPNSGLQHVIRGSSWAHGTNTELRLSYRDHGSDPRDDVGFRIARYAR
jgi:formylglycine-generating enzyme required for sulfatase activity/archaellum component FlaG (FlaF/FlaG flagellin family)